MIQISSWLNFVKFQDETMNPLVQPLVWGINPQNDNYGNKEKRRKNGGMCHGFLHCKKTGVQEI
jgi:hypothetical protein